MTLVDGFAGACARHPDRVAVTGPDEQLTYAVLDRRSAELAELLRGHGCGPGTLVGLCADRTAELVVLLVGVLRSGAAYVPLDPDLPPARLRFIAADAGLRLVVGPERHRGRVPGVSYVSPGSASEAPRGRWRPAGPADPAYVIYTSGSTGKPKGVVVTHANVTRLFAVTRDELGFGPEDVWTLFHSYAFDFSVWELWGALLAGGRLVVVPYVTSRAPDRFWRLLGDEGVTVLNQTPSAFRQLDTAAAAAGYGPTPLRLVVFGGERLDPAGLARWVDHYGDERPRLLNMYGITETTVHVTAHPLRRADLTAPVSPIGRPLPDLRVHLLDPRGRPVPAGTDGELHVGGAGVAAGYLGRPALTAERFLPDPWGAPGDRLYRSGDLARELPDGTLAFRGRIDDQVQLRGFRVEPGSVEHALAGLPGVRAAAVVVRDADLVAYVVGAGVSAVGLRTALASVLPAHEVPAVVVTVDALPLTGNGKVDRDALAALPVRRRPSDLPYSAPVTATERRVAAAVGEALDVSPVGRTDSFGMLGGDSLRAVRVLASLPGLTLPDLLAGDTVGELAARLDSLPAVRPADAPPAVGEASATQQRLLFLMSRSAGAAAAYTIPAVVRLRGPLDRSALAAALDDLVARHPTLRTRLTPTAHTVHATPVPAPRDLLQHEPFAGASLAELAAWPTDPGMPPSVRATLLGVGPEEHVLVLAVSHLAADGWSLAVLGRDLGALYAARLAGTAPPPPPTATYADFVAWQRREAARPGGPEHWARVLDGAPTVLELSDRPRPAAAAYAGLRVSRPVPATVRAAADRLARTERASPYAVQLAAFAAVLAARTGRRDLVIGCPAAGRPGTGFDDVVGCFVATLPLRLRWSGEPPFRSLVRDAYGVVLDALEHQQVPFEELVAAAGAAREPSRPPLVQVVFAYHGDQRFAPELPGVEVEPVVVDPGTARFDLLVEVTDGPDGTVVSAEADAALFDADEVAALLDEWVGTLAAAATEPDSPVRAARPRPAPVSPPPPDGTSGAATVPAPADGRATVAGGAAGEVEARLAGVWAEVLELPAVGRDDDFFALGGDSIRALRLVGAARAGGVEVSIEDLFRHRTIAALATAATSPPAAGDDTVRLSPADVERLPGGVGDAYPMAVLQQGIVFHCQLAEDPTLYHDVVSVRLAGRWDEDALREALAATAARHDVLRTSFDLGAYSEPLQLVHARVEVPLRVHGPDRSPPAERRRAWWRGEWQHGFDLGAAPLWRAHVLVHREDDVDLALSAHHSILDGWSLAALLTEVVRRYDGGRPPDPAPPPVRFRDFVAAERAQLADPAAHTFWTRTAGPPLPPDPHSSGGGEPPLEPDAVVEVEAQLVARVVALARGRGVPVRSLYLAAHVRALAAVRGTAEVATGVVVHGRPERVGAVETLGLFLNTLPLGATPGDRALADLAVELTAAEQERLPYRWYPLAEMQRRAGGPLHDSRFTFADFHVLAGLRELRRLRVLDWWSADRNEIPVSVEVVRHPLTGATAVEVRVTPAAGDARLARALAEAVVAELRQAVDG